MSGTSAFRCRATRISSQRVTLRRVRRRRSPLPRSADFEPRPHRGGGPPTAQARSRALAHPDRLRSERHFDAATADAIGGARAGRAGATRRAEATERCRARAARADGRRAGAHLAVVAVVEARIDRGTWGARRLIIRVREVAARRPIARRTQPDEVVAARRQLAAAKAIATVRRDRQANLEAHRVLRLAKVGARRAFLVSAGGLSGGRERRSNRQLVASI